MIALPTDRVLVRRARNGADYGAELQPHDLFRGHLWRPPRAHRRDGCNLGLGRIELDLIRLGPSGRDQARRDHNERQDYVRKVG